MKNLTVYDNETENEALWRIGQEKTNELLGAEVTWVTIAQVLNERFRESEETYYDSSAYRKRYKNFLDAYEQIFAKMSPSDESRQLEQQKEDIIKERQKLSATKVEYMRNLRHDSRFELFYDNIKDAIRVLPPPDINPIRVEDSRDNEYLLHMGDQHYGATFTSTNNEYSREICKQRFEKLLGYTIDYVMANNVSHLKILNVGDSIQGILRISDVKINEIPVVECVVEISQIIADFLNKLSAYCTIEYIHVTAANHGQTRPLGTKASELAAEDMEKIICNYIKDSLSANDRVKICFDIDKEYYEFEIAGFKCITEHGHRVRNPKNYLNDKLLLHRKLYSYGFLGHTHSGECITVGEEDRNNIEVLVCPSFVGSDPYSDTLNVGSKAAVNMLKFNKIYGHVGTEHFILN